MLQGATTALQTALLLGWISGSHASEKNESSCTGATTFDSDTVRLSLFEGELPPVAADQQVQVRGRRRLVYSSRALPEFVLPPSSTEFPLVAHADAIDATGAVPSISSYAAAARSLLREKLTTHGAVLFRGLPLSTGEDFAEFVDALGWDAVKLGGGGTQRTDVAKGVRTASDEPPEQTIEVRRFSCPLGAFTTQPPLDEYCPNTRACVVPPPSAALGHGALVGPPEADRFLRPRRPPRWRRGRDSSDEPERGVL